MGEQEEEEKEEDVDQHSLNQTQRALKFDKIKELKREEN